MHSFHADSDLPKFLKNHHIPVIIQKNNELGSTMIILTALRAIGAFFASLPGSVAEAQKLRREYHRHYPFAEF